MYVQYAKGSIWNSTELAEKAISAPNRQGLPQKDVEENITLLIRESKTSFWHKQLLWSPPARHVNRMSKRLACEKHMDWWPASTKPILKRYAKDDRSTTALTEERLQMAWAPRFLKGDVAQMVDRSLCMQEVRGSMPRISNFSEVPGNEKNQQQEAKLLDQMKTLLCTSNMQKEASETVQSLLRKRLVPRIAKVYLRKTSKKTLLFW